MLNWKLIHPKATIEMLGFIPEFLDENDPRPAKKQLDSNYSHGGGFRAMPGFKMLPNGDLKYPDDPPFAALAETKLRDEIIRVYNYAWVAVIQPDGSFEVCHMD